jgi:hypothetical protein
VALNILRMMFDLFQEEDIWDDRVARAYKDAFDIAMENNDAPRARIFATRAYEARRLIEGEDSITTICRIQKSGQSCSIPLRFLRTHQKYLLSKRLVLYFLGGVIYLLYSNILVPCFLS